MQKRILVFSVIINLLFLIMFGIHVQRNGGISYIMEKLGFNLSATYKLPTQKARYEYYEEKESLFEVLPKENNEIVFIGSSLVDGCEWSELFQNPKVKNRGIGGDKSEGVLRRMDEIVKSRPAKIFIMIGCNDLSQGILLDSILNNYRGIFDKIISLSPITKIYVQSLIPINIKLSKEYSSNEKVQTFNSRLKNLCIDKQITFIDLYSHFIDSENNLNMQYSFDGHHLSGKGYLVWKSVIEKYVN